MIYQGITFSKPINTRLKTQSNDNDTAIIMILGRIIKRNVLLFNYAGACNAFRYYTENTKWS